MGGLGLQSGGPKGRALQHGAPSPLPCPLQRPSDFRARQRLPDSWLPGPCLAQASLPGVRRVCGRQGGMSVHIDTPGSLLSVPGAWELPGRWARRRETAGLPQPRAGAWSHGEPWEAQHAEVHLPPAPGASLALTNHSAKHVRRAGEEVPGGRRPADHRDPRTCGFPWSGKHGPGWFRPGSVLPGLAPPPTGLTPCVTVTVTEPAPREQRMGQ